MIQVCYYKDCGVVYGEKEPLSDKRTTHGLCSKHLEISLKEIRAEIGKKKGREWHGNHPDLAYPVTAEVDSRYNAPEVD